MNEPPTLFLLGLMAVGGLWIVWPGPEIIPGAWRWLGIPTMLLGVWLNIVASGLFERLGTPIRPMTPSTVLVTTGVFRFTRNPMYLGMVLSLAGAAIGSGGLATLAVPLAFAGWIQRRFIRPEEALLHSTFGEAYRRYQARVRRWV